MNEKISEKYKYTKMFLEIVIQNAYDEVYSRDNGKRVYIDPNADQSMEKTVNGQVELTDEQLEEIVSQKNGIFLTPPNKYEYYRPNTVIKDIDELEKKLGQYVEAIYSSEKNFYRIDDEHSISTYFYYLIKTLTNSDSQDLIEYIDVFIGFLKDNMFSWLEDESKIGRIALGEEEHQQYDVLAKRTEEYYGSETPYTMRYALDRKGFKYTMPFVRYGISGKEAYIYSIQRKGKLNYRYTKIKEIHGSFNRVNSGIKHERDITPSMLISATMFMGMLSGAGVEKVRVSDFLTRRFGHYNGINSNFEEACRIQSNITNKFLRTFTRLVSQFKGIEITSYPNDIDSYLYLKLGNDISSNNPLLDEFFQLGFECSKKQKKEIKKNGEGIAK